MSVIGNETVTLYLGDCLATLRTLPDNSVDSIVTEIAQSRITCAGREASK